MTLPALVAMAALVVPTPPISTPRWLVLPMPPGDTRPPMGDVMILLVLTGQMKPPGLGVTSEVSSSFLIWDSISFASFSSAAASSS